MTMSTGTGRPRTSGGLRGSSQHHGGSPGRSFRPSGVTRGGGGGGASRFSSFSRGGDEGSAAEAIESRGSGGGGVREHSVEVSYASWVQAVGEGAEGRLPAGRSEVELLRAWLKGQLEKTAAAHDDFGGVMHKALKSSPTRDREKKAPGRLQTC